jgi:hypothetical protein
MGWNLPPGVTQRDLDAYFDGDGYEPCECDEIYQAELDRRVAAGQDEDEAYDRLAEDAADGDFTCDSCHQRLRDELAADDAAEYDPFDRED